MTSTQATQTTDTTETTDTAGTTKAAVDATDHTAAEIAGHLTEPADVRARIHPVTFMRLLRVEARKLVDTRAGRWLLGICAIVTAATVWGCIVWLPEAGTTELLGLAATPAALLVPVVAILSATAEWSQRTGLVTFALEPRRHRVVAAKLCIAALAGIVAVGFTLAMSMGGLGVAALLGDGPDSWALSTPEVAGLSLVFVLTMLQAAAFGFAFLNTPAAVVLFFVLPTLMTTITSLSTWFAERAAWLDLGAAGMPFMSGTATGSDWTHLASASAIWILLPLFIGLVRIVRSDLK